MMGTLQPLLFQLTLKGMHHLQRDDPVLAYLLSHLGQAPPADSLKPQGLCWVVCETVLDFVPPMVHRLKAPLVEDMYMLAKPACNLRIVSNC